MFKMRIIFLFFLFVCLNGYSQIKCEKLSKGINFYNKKEYKDAIKEFKNIYKNSEEGDNCYIESCLWLSKSYYYATSSYLDGDVSKYLVKAIKFNDIEALRFYSLEMKYYDNFISNNINIDSYLNKYDKGEIYFFIGNIYAKKLRFIKEDELFQFLEKSIENGYSDDILYKENYIKEVNPELYNSIVGNFELNLKRFVEKRINYWQKKGKFEKTATYVKRVNEESREYEIKRLTQYYIDSLGASRINFKKAINEYDADNEVFKITFNNLNSIYLPVPLDEARIFDQNFANVEYEDPNFTYFDNNFEIIHLEIINPYNKKRYIFDSKDLLAFNTNEISFNFDNIDINLTEKSSGNNVIENNNVINVGKSDVDQNIPVNSDKYKNKYALIIGNEDYTMYQSGLNTESNVDFANRDAEIFAEYCEKTLGIPKENIVLLKDAISSQINRELEKLTKLALYSKGEAELIFYYAGHGFPDEKTKESYLMPVDISGTDVTLGIKLSDLYSKLTKYPTKKVTVFLDACFSGGGRNQGLLAARSVKIQPKENLIDGNLVVFSASTGEQSSLPYKEKQHGMFTYFLLKKLQETKGNVSYDELSDFIKTEVQLNSVKINSKDQNPQILTSPSLTEEWKKWNLK